MEILELLEIEFALCFDGYRWTEVLILINEWSYYCWIGYWYVMDY